MGCKKCCARLDWLTDGKDADGCHEILMCSQCYSTEKKYFPCEGVGELVDVTEIDTDESQKWDWDTLPF